MDERSIEKAALALGQGPLKNEFREEVRDPYSGIPEEELITRDQAVLLRELRFRVGCGKSDVIHIRGAIEDAKALRGELLCLPKSPYKEICLQDLDQYIKNSEVKLGTLGPTRSTVLQLLALEELFAEPESKSGINLPLPGSTKYTITMTAGAAPPELAEDTEAEDELTIPDEVDVDEDDDPRETI